MLLLVVLNYACLTFEGGDGSSKPTPYEEALDALSSLITKRSRADTSNNGDCFELLSDYLKVIFFTSQITYFHIWTDIYK